MKRILIADDQKFMRRTLKDALCCEQYEIIEAENGDEATKKFIEYQPDVLIIDLLMPHLDGFAAIENIKSCNHKAKIIVISSEGTEKTVKKLMRLGIRSFISKPVKIDKLLQEVESVA